MSSLFNLVALFLRFFLILNVFIGSIKEVNVEQGLLLSRVTEDCVPGFVAP